MGKGKAKEYQWHIEWRNPDELIPYDKNAKIHDDKQVKNIANSLKRFGWQQPGVVTKDGVLIIGHGRRLAAQKLGVSMPVKVIEDDLTEEDIKELRIADNVTNESAWDFDLRREDIEGLSFDGFDFDFDDPFSDDSTKEDEEHYSQEVKIPQYEPTGEKPTLSQCIDTEKVKWLIDAIRESNVSREEKEFLTYAAYRHLMFNYKNIADYYANSSEEMQKLMEMSALVIIDLNDAIANGFAKLESDLEQLAEDEAE